MHHSGPLPLTFEGWNKVLGAKTVKMGVGENLGVSNIVLLNFTRIFINGHPC